MSKDFSHLCERELRVNEIAREMTRKKMAEAVDKDRERQKLEHVRYNSLLRPLTVYMFL